MKPLQGLEEVSDIKTAVSEAVTNAIIHGYDAEFMKEGNGQSPDKVYLNCMIEDDVLYVEVKDKGKGIADVEQAMEPLYTSKPEMDRSGMGFAFMDDLEVISQPGLGTEIRMKKKLGTTPWIGYEE